MSENGGAMLDLVELALFGRDLPEVDRFSSTDPFLVALMSKGGKEWKVVGRTETVWDEPNPDFSKKIRLPYASLEDKDAVMMIKLYDNDASRKKKSQEESMSDDYLKKQKYLGATSFVLGDLVERYPYFQKLELDGLGGFLIVHGRPVRETSAEPKHLSLKLDAVRTYKTRKKVFIVVCKRLDDSSLVGPRWTPIWRSEALPFSATGVEFGGFSTYEYQDMRVELYEYHRRGGHVSVASCEVPLMDEATADIDFSENSGLKTGTLIIDNFGRNLATLRFHNFA